MRISRRYKLFLKFHDKPDYIYTYDQITAEAVAFITKLLLTQQRNMVFFFAVNILYYWGIREGFSVEHSVEKTNT